MFSDDPLSVGDAGLGPFPPPPLGTEADPFYAFRDELAGLCRQALQELDQLRLPSASSSPSEKLAAISAFRSATARVLRENIAHLEKVVAHIERNAKEFALAPQEVASRRGFLETVQRHVAKLERDVDLLMETHKQLANKQALQDQLEMQRVLKAQREQQRRARPTASTAADDDHYARFHHQQQMQTQDQSLEEISSTLGRLKQVGNEVYHEIEAQNVLLEDLQGDTDEAEGRMATAMSRLDKILHTSSRGHTCAILVLVGFLFGEVLLVTIL